VLILFDHGTPQGLTHALPGHTVHTAQAKGWDTLSNGALLNALEAAGFELCSGPTGGMSNAGMLGVAPNEIRLWVQATLDLLESLQHPTALAANGCPGVIAGVCCHQGVREIRLPQFTRGNG